MVDPIKSNEVPPILKKRNTTLLFLRIGLLIAVIVFVIAKVKQYDSESKLPVTSFLLLGEPGTKFSFSATSESGELVNITTQMSEHKQKVLATDKLKILSCKLERLEGVGAITLEIFIDTNLMATAELAKDKRVVELKQDSWSQREY